MKCVRKVKMSFHKSCWLVNCMLETEVKNLRITIIEIVGFTELFITFVIRI